jgi:hypothetical protein
MAKGLKYILLTVLLILLSLPLVQQLTGVFEEWPLDGYTEQVTTPDLTAEQVLSGSFMADIERFAQQEIGLRSYLVRLHNQIYYSLFNIAKANNVVVCRDGMLLDADYIDAYYGDDLLGEEVILSWLSKWKRLQDTLDVYGTKAVLVFAPGKASYFPEFFPKRMRQQVGSPTNYEVMQRFSDSLGVRFIDLKAYFHEIMDTATYPLFTLGGIHWSEYGAVLAQMQLGRELGAMLGRELDVLPFGTETDIQPRGTDNDIERGMNLLMSTPRQVMAYPVPRYSKDAFRPSLLAIGDSYYWNLFHNGFSDRMCRRGGFWYYFREAHPQELYGHLAVNELDLRQEVLANDVLLLMMTEPQLQRMGWGSVEALCDVFCTDPSETSR